MIEEIKTLLNLSSHVEGGFFVETYRSNELIAQKALPDRFDGNRCLSTAIYYMLTPETYSAIHKLQSDEIYHFYQGDPVEMLQLYPDGSGRIIILGSDILNGMQPQVAVPKGVWQGSRLSPGGRFALMGTTVSPGFEYFDFETGNRETLQKTYPEFKDQIEALSIKK